MADIKTHLNTQRETTPRSIAGTWVARITRPVPLLESDPVFVVIPDIDNNIKWGPCEWFPRSTQTGVSSQRTLDFQQRNSDFNVTAITEATAQAVLTSGSMVFDGFTPIIVEFWAPATNNNNGAKTIRWIIQDNGTNLGIGYLHTAAAAGPDLNGFNAKYQFTPSTGTHVISSAVYTSAATFTIRAGAGGTATYAPMSQRIVGAGSNQVMTRVMPVLGDGALVVFDNQGKLWVVHYGD